MGMILKLRHLACCRFLLMSMKSSYSSFVIFIVKIKSFNFFIERTLLFQVKDLLLTPPVFPREEVNADGCILLTATLFYPGVCSILEGVILLLFSRCFSFVIGVRSGINYVLRLVPVFFYSGFCYFCSLSSLNLQLSQGLSFGIQRVMLGFFEVNICSGFLSCFDLITGDLLASCLMFSCLDESFLCGVMLFRVGVLLAFFENYGLLLQFHGRFIQYYFDFYLIKLRLKILDNFIRGPCKNRTRWSMPLRVQNSSMA